MVTSPATTPRCWNNVYPCIVASLSIETVTHMHLSTHQGHERCDAMWWHHGVLKQCASMSCCCYKNIANNHMHHSSKLRTPPLCSTVSRYAFRIKSHAHVYLSKKKKVMRGRHMFCKGMFIHMMFFLQTFTPSVTHIHHLMMGPQAGSAILWAVSNER